MSNTAPKPAFDENHAANYDEKFKKLNLLKESLHLCMQLALANLPNDAHILCVGAGTGAEILALAKAFPNWSFTAVEPSATMLTACRQKMRDNDFEKRCIFFEGYLDDLPKTCPFDAATSILVSQFIKEDNKRIAFFHSINRRLKDNGLLISADIATELTNPHSEPLINIWKQMYIYSDMPANTLENSMQIMNIHSAEKTAALIEAGGFNKPIVFNQNLLIHAWFAKKA